MSVLFSQLSVNRMARTMTFVKMDFFFFFHSLDIYYSYFNSVNEIDTPGHKVHVSTLLQPSEMAEQTLYMKIFLTFFKEKKNVNHV